MISSLLPAPKHQYTIYGDVDSDEESAKIIREEESKKAKKEIPPYLQRSSFVPVDLDDFGDGGAYPEIHVIQYPLNMGKPGVKSTAVITVDVDENGQVRYDAIVKQGTNKNKIVQTSLSDLKEKAGDQDVIALPDAKEEDETAERTRLALESLLQGKIAKSKPSNAVSISEASEPEYIRYTANPEAPGFNPGLQNRVIRMVEAQVDPMEPPKHKHKKVPRGSGSPPVPVLHSPPRKLTVEDQQAWKIPPCVSNWKNARGYTIPLDKRLAADGRGLQETTINNKFATLSESLYIAERKAQEELTIRNQIRKKMSMKEKEDKEAELREMANRARMERSGVMDALGGLSAYGAEDLDEPSDEKDYYRANTKTAAAGAAMEARDNDMRYHSGGGGAATGTGGTYGREELDNDSGSEGSRSDGERSAPIGETDAERVARIQREKLRVERRKERERQLRLENMKGNMRKNKVDRDEGRDISEKIALGMHKGTTKLSGEALYDSRLFNQSSGLDSGFGADDEYSAYSKPLFDRTEASTIYRPKRDDADVYGDVDTQIAKLTDTSRFKADRGFKGAEEHTHKGGRSEPVQFETATGSGHRSSDHGADESSKKRSRHDDD